MGKVLILTDILLVTTVCHTKYFPLKLYNLMLTLNDTLFLTLLLDLNVNEFKL